MINRRQLVKRSLAAGFSVLGAARLGAANTAARRAGYLVLKSPVDDLLAEESRAGFLSILPAGTLVTGLEYHTASRTKIIVLPAAQNLSREHLLRLRHSVETGARLIWEQRAAFGDERAAANRELVNNIFEIGVRGNLRAESGIYVHYRRPAAFMVRAFEEITLLQDSRGDVIAEYDGEPVAIRRRYGEGRLIFLGSMLGPGIRAGEPQARQVVRALCGLSDL